MFATMKAGKTAIGELSQFYFQAIGASDSLDVSFEELSADLITLTKQGRKTPIAMTQLRSVMTALTTPSAELSGIFKAPGYDSAEAAIKSEGLNFALNAVHDATGGSYGALTALLGRSEAVAAVLGLAGDKTRIFNEAMEDVENSAGKMQEAFQKRAGAAVSLYEGEKTKFDNLTKMVGKESEKVFLVLWQAVGNATDKIMEFRAEFPQLFAVLVQTGTVIAIVVSVAGTITPAHKFATPSHADF